MPQSSENTEYGGSVDLDGLMLQVGIHVSHRGIWIADELAESRVN